MSHTRIALFVLFSFLPLRAVAADLPVGAEAPVPAPVVVTQEASAPRPQLLTGLYGASVALHAYDAYVGAHNAASLHAQR